MTTAIAKHTHMHTQLKKQIFQSTVSSSDDIFLLTILVCFSTTITLLLFISLSSILFISKIIIILLFIAVVDADMDLYLNLKGKTHDGRTVYTYIRPTTEPGTLLSMVDELPACKDTENLTRLHVFSSKDDKFSLNMFVYGESHTSSSSSSSLTKNNEYPLASDDENAVATVASEPHRNKILAFSQEVRNGQHTTSHPDLDPAHVCFREESLHQYLNKCRDNYLKVISEYPERFLKQRLLFESVSGTEGCNAQIEEAVHEEQHLDFHDDDNRNNHKQYWLDVAMANSFPQVALYHTCRLLFVQGFDVGRARLDVIPDSENGSVTMLRLLIHPTQISNEIEDSSAFPYSTKSKFERLESNLKRMKWLDDTTMKLVFDDQPWLGVKRGEIITGMANLLQPIMVSKSNAETGRMSSSLFYSKHSILVRCFINIENRHFFFFF